MPMIRPTGARPPPATAASRAAPAAASARPAAAAPTAGNQHDPKTRELYSKFVETRRSLGESTASVTMDGIAKSIRESGEKLRQKHPGKNIEFDVQVKDGKAVLKPIVR